MTVRRERHPATLGPPAAIGAAEAARQPTPTAWRVLLDAVGHPFCLTTVTGD
jgi:hypothetical protein